MKYGVIVCPKCGMAKGVESARKTTTCNCGREIDLAKMKLMFQTDSPKELAESVGKANAALRGGGQMPTERKRRKDPYYVIAEAAKPVKDPLERMRLVAKGLSELGPDFGLEELRKVAAILGRDSPEDMLARLKEHNLVYESEPGRYRSV